MLRSESYPFMALVVAVLSNLFPQFPIFSVYIKAFSLFEKSNFLYPIKGNVVSWILQMETFVC